METFLRHIPNAKKEVMMMKIFVAMIVTFFCDSIFMKSYWLKKRWRWWRYWWQWLWQGWHCLQGRRQTCQCFCQSLCLPCNQYNGNHLTSFVFAFGVINVIVMITKISLDFCVINMITNWKSTLINVFANHFASAV